MGIYLIISIEQFTIPYASKKGGGMWICGLDWTGPGQRQVADACECGNEPSGSVKCGEFLD